MRTSTLLAMRGTKQGRSESKQNITHKLIRNNCPTAFPSTQISDRLSRPRPDRLGDQIALIHSAPLNVSRDSLSRLGELCGKFIFSRVKRILHDLGDGRFVCLRRRCNVSSPLSGKIPWLPSAAAAGSTACCGLLAHLSPLVGARRPIRLF